MKAILNFFQIHREMIFGDPPIMIQDMFRITPKAFDPIDMSVGSAGHQGEGVLDRRMSPIPFSRLVTAKSIREIHRAVPGRGLTMLHQFLRADRLDHLGLHPSLPLQEPKHDAFARRSAPQVSFAPATEIGLSPFALSLQFARFQFCNMIQRFAHPVIDTGDDFHVRPQVRTQPIGRLPLREALPDPNCPATPPKVLAFPTAPNISHSLVGYKALERSRRKYTYGPAKSWPHDSKPTFVP